MRVDPNMEISEVFQELRPRRRGPIAAGARWAWLGLALVPLLVPGSSSPAAARNTLILRLIVHQPGTVRLDGQEFLDLTRASGQAPEPWRHFVMQYVPVEPGKHEISLRPDDVFAVPPFEQVSVEGAAGDTVGVVLGRPRIITSPPGARVTINGNPEGNTPLAINPADLVKTSVVIELRKYETQTLSGDSILAVARDGGSYRLEMKPVKSGESSLQPLGAPPRSYWDRNRTLALGTSVALLTAGIYAGLRFKDQADSKYAEYRRTGNAARQKDLFGQAEHFDRLSLLGWGVGEAAFLATFFLIIHESPRGLVPTDREDHALVPTARVEHDRASGESRVEIGVTHAF